MHPDRTDVVGPQLVAISGVRDERDIVEAFVRHTLTLASHLYIIDHGSTDGTSEILAALRLEGLPLTVLRDDTLGNDQGGRMTRLLRLAATQTDAEWFLPIDADEFLQGWPTASLPAGQLVTLRWRNFVPHEDDELAEQNPACRIRRRRLSPMPEDTKVLIPRLLAVRDAVAIRQGNHGVTIAGQDVPCTEQSALTLAHFPVRSPQQYLAKMTIRALQYAITENRDPSWGWAFDQVLAGALQDPRAVAGGFAAAARRYALPEAISGDIPLVVDPIDYRGGPLRYTPPPSRESAYRSLLAFAQQLATRSRSQSLPSQDAGAAERERLLRDQTVAIRQLEQRMQQLESDCATARRQTESVGADMAKLESALHRSWTWRMGRSIVGPVASFSNLVSRLRQPQCPNPDLRDAQRINLGAAGKQFPGWFSTDRNVLDITRRGDFARAWPVNSRDAFVAEHVWEHLTEFEARQALRNCFEFLRPGGRLRIGVPDGCHPDPAYQNWVRPGGVGPGADDHKQLYDYRTLSAQVRAAGLEVALVEHWDEHGQFHRRDWIWDDGPVRRSAQHDPRNVGGALNYTSLIVDCFKPRWAPGLAA